MTDHSRQASTNQREDPRREERADRILDAAAALILRWGYNKTTIDDISRQAGVAKGTIYLHWKAREELFAALMRRENAEWTEDLRQRIAGDPAGSTLRGVFKHSALALMKRPLLKALILRDVEVIGKLAHGDQGSAVAAEKLAGFSAYLEFLREQGLVRSDLSLRAQNYVLTAVFLGFFLVAPLMPQELNLSDEEMADLIGETVHRSLESGRAATTDELQAVAGAFGQYLDHRSAALQEQPGQEREA